MSRKKPAIGTDEWYARTFFEMQKSLKWRQLAPWWKMFYRQLAKHIHRQIKAQAKEQKP